MIKTIDKNDRPLFRIIIPAFPEEVGVFTRQAKKTTALGPIMVATAANKLWRWKVEVFDENNCPGAPKDKNGLLDHAVLQRERPATVVGFYCGLTSTIERVWELAEFYHEVLTIAAGWHAHHCPKETLNHGIDIVVHGDGEIVIRQILNALEKGSSLENILGTSFLENGQLKTNASEIVEVLGSDSNLDGLPYPDFGLLKYAKIKIYPVGRIRGCSMNCEPCAVKRKPHWASAEHLFNTVRWLVETRKARHFFIVDDRLEEDIGGTIEFFKMISSRYGNRLHFTVQTRLDTAKNIKLLEVMKRAGVRVVCIGYESPVDKDLRAMRKGYSSSDMLELTKVWHRYVRWIHAMFMVGYPLKEKKDLVSAKEIFKCFARFIRKASPDSVQILITFPVVGSDLRQRLEQEGRIFPLSLVPWSRYNGIYPCFKPDSMSVRELQGIPIKLMSRFYNPWSLVRIPLRIIPGGIYLVRGWKYWYHGWDRDVIKFGAHLLIQKWQRKQKEDRFIERLEEYQLKYN